MPSPFQQTLARMTVDELVDLVNEVVKTDPIDYSVVKCDEAEHRRQICTLLLNSFQALCDEDESFLLQVLLSGLAKVVEENAVFQLQKTQWSALTVAQAISHLNGLN